MQRQISLHTSLPDDIAVFNADNADTVTQAAKAVGEVRWFSRKQRVDNGVFCEDGVIYEAADGSGDAHHGDKGHSAARCPQY